MILEALLPRIFVVVASLDDPEKQCPHCLGKMALVCKTWFDIAEDLAIEYEIVFNWETPREFFPNPHHRRQKGKLSENRDDNIHNIIINDNNYD